MFSARAMIKRAVEIVDDPKSVNVEELRAIFRREAAREILGASFARLELYRGGWHPVAISELVDGVTCTCVWSELADWRALLGESAVRPRVHGNGIFEPLTPRESAQGRPMSGAEVELLRAELKPPTTEEQAEIDYAEAEYHDEVLKA